MRKKLISLLLFIVLIVGAFGFNVLAHGDVSVYVDGSRISFDVEPQIINGRTMVPLRAIFEVLGATVLWDNDTRTVTAFNNECYVVATIDKISMTVNGENKEMDVPPMIVSGRTLVPARFVAEAFGCDVKWDGDTKTVSITSKSVSYEEPEENNNENIEEATGKNEQQNFSKYTSCQGL